MLLYVFMLLNAFTYVKGFELPLCMKVARQINLPCIALSELC